MPVQPRSRGRWILESWSRGHLADLIELLVAVELPEPQLPRRRQTVQQEQRAVFGRQYCLGLHAPPELLDHALDDVGRTQSLPLALGEAVEGQQLRAGFFQALDHRGAPLLPFRRELQPRTPRRLLLLGVNDLVVVLVKFVMQALWGRVLSGCAVYGRCTAAPPLS